MRLLLLLILFFAHIGYASVTIESLHYGKLKGILSGDWNFHDSGKTSFLYKSSLTKEIAKKDQNGNYYFPNGLKGYAFYVPGGSKVTLRFSSTKNTNVILFVKKQEDYDSNDIIDLAIAPKYGSSRSLYIPQYFFGNIGKGKSIAINVKNRNRVNGIWYYLFVASRDSSFPVPLAFSYSIEVQNIDNFLEWFVRSRYIDEQGDSNSPVPAFKVIYRQSPSNKVTNIVNMPQGNFLYDADFDPLPGESRLGHYFWFVNKSSYPPPKASSGQTYGINQHWIDVMKKPFCYGCRKLGYMEDFYNKQNEQSSSQTSSASAASNVSYNKKATAYQYDSIHQAPDYYYHKKGFLQQITNQDLQSGKATGIPNYFVAMKKYELTPMYKIDCLTKNEYGQKICLNESELKRLGVTPKWCSNGWKRAKIYLPQGLKNFTLGVMIQPNATIGMMATFIPDGEKNPSIDMTKFKELKDFNYDMDKFYRYFLQGNHPIFFTADSAGNIIDFNDLKDKSAMRSGWIYLAFTQASEIADSWRGFIPRPRVIVSAQYYLKDDKSELQQWLKKTKFTNNGDPVEAFKVLYERTKSCDSSTEYNKIYGNTKGQYVIAGGDEAGKSNNSSSLGSGAGLGGLGFGYGGYAGGNTGGGYGGLVGAGAGYGGAGGSNINGTGGGNVNAGTEGGGGSAGGGKENPLDYENKQSSGSDLLPEPFRLVKTRPQSGTGLDFYNLDGFDFIIDYINHNAKLPKPEDMHTDYETIADASKAQAILISLDDSMLKTIVHKNILYANALEEYRMFVLRAIEFQMSKCICR